MNVLAQTWEEISVFPGQERDDAVAFSIENVGFVCTGSTSTALESNKLWKFDPNTSTWTEVAPFIGEARQYASAFVINQNAYLVGGYSFENQALKDVYVYNSIADTWKKLNDFPGLARWSSSAISDKVHGYLFTGTTLDSCLSDCWKYDPNTDKWTEIAAFPAASRRETVSFQLYDNYYVGMGFSTDPINHYNDIYQYFPGENRWEFAALYPGECRSYTSTCSIAGKAVFIGGSGVGFVFENEAFSLNQQLEWTTLPEFETLATRGLCTFSLNNVPYFGTGLDENFNKQSRFKKLIDLEEALSDFSFFPNPCLGDLELYGSFQTKIKVYNTVGRLVHFVELDQTGFEKIKLTIAGTYYIHFLKNEQVWVKKVVVL